MSLPKYNKVSQQLPEEIRLMLVKAAAVAHPVQRIAAIEAAQAKGRALFSHLFHKVAE